MLRSNTGITEAMNLYFNVKHLRTETTKLLYEASDLVPENDELIEHFTTIDDELNDVHALLTDYIKTKENESFEDTRHNAIESMMTRLDIMRDTLTETTDAEEFAKVSKEYQQLLRRLRFAIDCEVRKHNEV